MSAGTGFHQASSRDGEALDKLHVSLKSFPIVDTQFGLSAWDLKDHILASPPPSAWNLRRKQIGSPGLAEG